MQSPDLTTDIGPTTLPTAGLLSDVQSRSKKRRHRADPTVRSLASKYLTYDDYRTIQACRKPILRQAHDDANGHRLRAASCKSMWCPWCIRQEHRAAAKFQAARIMSLHPKKELSLRNIVFTLPPSLRPYLAQDPTRLVDFKRAAMTTLARVYGFTTHKQAMKELGAIVNVHAWGDDAPGWPKFHPHLDCLIPAVRIHNETVAFLPDEWPSSKAATRKIYREELRAVFSKFVPGGEHNFAIAGDFPVVLRWGTKIVSGDQAHHRVWYSCRPLFDMSRARLETKNGRDVLVYEPQGSDVIHRVPAAPAMAAVYNMRPFLNGGEVSSQHGTLSRRSYAHACKVAGNEPVHRREKTGWKIVSVYKPGPDGRYDPEGDDLRRRLFNARVHGRYEQAGG